MEDHPDYHPAADRLGTAGDEPQALAHDHPLPAHVRTNSSSELVPQPNPEETRSLLNPSIDAYSLRTTPTQSSRYPPPPPPSGAFNSAHPLSTPVSVFSASASPSPSLRRNHSDCLLARDQPRPTHPYYPQLPSSPLVQPKPTRDAVVDRSENSSTFYSQLPNPIHTVDASSSSPSSHSTLPNQSPPLPPPSPPSHHPLSFVSSTPSSRPSYQSRAYNSSENLLKLSSAPTYSSTPYNHHSGSPRLTSSHRLLPPHSYPFQSPPPSPILVQTPDMTTNQHNHPQHVSSLPFDHPSFNILSQYSPPPPPPQHHAPYVFGQPNSLLSSLDEFKHSPNDELKGSYADLHPPHISKNAGYPKGFQPPMDPPATKSSHPGRGPYRKFLMIGYRRLAIVTLAGLLLILAAVGIIVYTHLKRADHPPEVTGDSDGDVVGQSGLGSARNTSASAGLDPFNATNSAFGPDNGLRGGINGYDSLVVFGASYCDNAHVRPANLHRTLKPLPYYKGRWSNGFVWNEYLSAIIGPGGRSTTLVNYAFGGATVDNSLNEAPVPDLEQQVNAFLSDLSAQSAGAGPSNGKSLIAVWVGINSITKIWNSVLKQEGQARSQTDVQDIMTKAQLNIHATVDHIFEVVTNLIHTTAFKAAVPDLLLLPIPPAQLLLVNLHAAKGNAGAIRTLATLSDLFNSRFADQLSGFQGSLATEQRVFTLDIPAIWHRFIDTPAAANLTVVDQPCLTKAGVCSSPGSYLFWDTLHPTTHIHEQLALMMASEIKR
ncbi:hypothetical protein PCANC_05312 [Puccinia coronata f. sp. avenae]|uniref:Carbohydrate esterase family 16 protein n=1 Tax=Puccinia coronata f. sp. avenae TaxID=200324 RepID=A0A2N5VYR6_9BASI|nr:hypothetical protein PCANC_05312 [Puccinia coronata f. sp. avenae]